MKKLSLMAGVAMLVALAPGSSKAAAVDAGVLLCKSLLATGEVTGCTVRDWGKTVVLQIDTNSSEARQICYSTAYMLSKKTRGFYQQGWTLQIISPYGGRLASCPLHGTGFGQENF